MRVVVHKKYKSKVKSSKIRKNNLIGTQIKAQFKNIYTYRTKQLKLQHSQLKKKLNIQYYTLVDVAVDADLYNLKIYTTTTNR